MRYSEMLKCYFSVQATKQPCSSLNSKEVRKKEKQNPPPVADGLCNEDSTSFELSVSIAACPQ